ncbi:hypothetical protein A9R05_44615 (plasmid) [Burkholderia sp. KK1]|nr:hypothetical protein A9R05_44615 [Burkholderia sp. KK1]
MKDMMGKAAIVATVGWLVWTGFANTPCERVYRSAAPVRASFDVLRWVSKNFISSEAKLDQIEWSIEADAVTQRYTGQLLYGSSFSPRNCSE